MVMLDWLVHRVNHRTLTGAPIDGPVLIVGRAPTAEEALRRTMAAGFTPAGNGLRYYAKDFRLSVEKGGESEL